VRVLLVALAALALAPHALAGGPTLQIGAADDAVKQPTLAQTTATLQLLQLAGLDSVRISETWAPGLTAPMAKDAAELANVAGAAQLLGLKVYVSVANYGSRTTPLSDQDQSDFAAYAAWIAAKHPNLAGVIVGNEPNLNGFWLPQFNADGTDAAAPAYESLLAKTYDAVKAAQPSLQVIGGALSPHGGDASSFGGIRPTHSPTAFIQDLGTAYRASGRAAPIMDAFGFHPYGDNSSQPPSFAHPNTTSIGIGDYTKLVALLGTAFDGTGQSGSTLPILYDEYGVESQIPATLTDLYTGTEKPTSKPVDETTQGQYYQQAIALSFCQPNVEGLLLFHAFDEGSLQGWQSGVYYVNKTPKPSLAVVRTAAAQSRRGVVAQCPGLLLTPALTFVQWPKTADLKQGRVRLVIACDIDCRWTATLPGRRISGAAVGGLKATLDFGGRVTKGTKTLTITLTAPLNAGPPLVRTHVVKVP